MTKLQAEFILCVVVWIVAIIFGLETKDMKSPSNILPATMIIIMSVLAGVIFIKNIFLLVKGKVTDNPELFTKSSILNVGGIAIATLVYVYLIPILGFYFSSGIFLSLLYLILSDTKFQVRTVIKSVMGGCLVTLLIFFIFDYLLEVTAPRGLFF